MVTENVKIQNDALKMLLAGTMNPMVQQMEEIWKNTDDRHEGAQCMAGYLMQFADRVGVTDEGYAVTDALVAMIEKRWEATT